MKKSLFGILLACSVLLMGQSIAQQQPELRADYPQNYTVVRGDTLWDISSRFLRNPWMWPEIWHVNPQIENPHLIYPGDVIRLVYLDGQPRLMLDSSDRVVRLSPQVRELPYDEAIPAIPLDQINKFLSRSRVLSAAEIDSAPHVVSGEAQRLVLGKDDRLYARGDFDPNISVYGVYRKGQTYVDPDTREVLGVEAMDIGSGRMRALEGEIATLLMTRTTEEVRVGDRLLVEEQRPIDSLFHPSAPSEEVNAQIIAVEGGLTQVGKMDVVVINRGTRENMAAGHVLAVYKRGGTVRDRVRGDMVELPHERAGLVMVFRTFEKLSLGLVLEADRPLAIKDLVRNP